jgi:hypothetical protein
MSSVKSEVSRRRFLGGSISAAVGGLAAVSLPRNVLAQEPVPASSLDALKPPQTLDEAYWWKVRSQFNVRDGLTFMNTGTFGPPPRVVLDEHTKIQRELAEDPRDNYRSDELHENKTVLAEFVGADPDEIAYMRSTTEGMNNFANGIDFRAGDEVLMNSHEHPGGYGAYQALERKWWSCMKMPLRRRLAPSW